MLSDCAKSIHEDEKLPERLKKTRFRWMYAIKSLKAWQIIQLSFLSLTGSGWHLCLTFLNSIARRCPVLRTLAASSPLGRWYMKYILSWYFVADVKTSTISVSVEELWLRWESLACSRHRGCSGAACAARFSRCWPTTSSTTAPSDQRPAPTWETQIAVAR